MDTGRATSKEATILGLAYDIQKLLRDLQERLDNRFQRAMVGEEDKAETPTVGNVLDEILETLEKDRAHLAHIMSFISSDVLPKIN